MPEYIERSEAIEFTKQNTPNINGETTMQCVERSLLNVPAADVVEVVHGHNKTSMHPVDEFLCSVCGFCCADYTETKYDEDGDYEYSCECEFDYCPKCGAKMDRKGD